MALATRHFGAIFSEELLPVQMKNHGNPPNKMNAAWQLGAHGVRGSVILHVTSDVFRPVLRVPFFHPPFIRSLAENMGRMSLRRIPVF